MSTFAVSARYTKVYFMDLTESQRNALLRIQKGDVTNHKSSGNDFPHHKTLEALRNAGYITKPPVGAYKVTATGAEALKK